MTDLEFLKQTLIQKKNELAEAMIRQHAHTKTRQPKNNIPSETVEEDSVMTAIAIRSELIHILASALTDNLEEADRSISDWSNRVAELSLRWNSPMEDAIGIVKYYRTFIWEEIHRLGEIHALPLSVIFESMKRLDPLLDQAVYVFSLRYVKAHKEQLDRVQRSFLEISTPIVPVFTGVAVLPLIGEFSEERAKVIMEQILQKAVHLKLEHLFIDLSGVITMDTMVAHEIIRIVSSLELLGIQARLTGIRPEIARTIVNLGINFKTESRGSLKQAIQEFVGQQGHLV